MDADRRYETFGLETKTLFLSTAGNLSFGLIPILLTPQIPRGDMEGILWMLDMHS